MKCPKCGKEMPDSNRFCTNCGSPLSISGETDSNVSVIKNKALWNIQPGEIARKISELDFLNLNTVSGLVVQPGVTAILYINGKEVAQINSGIYNFIEDEKIQAEMDRKVQSTGVTSLVAKIWKSMVRFITGRKDNQTEVKNKIHSTSEIISSLNEKSIISVYLKRDTNFPAFFGSTATPDGRRTFEPMRIRTRILDVEIGVQMFLKIDDFHAFLQKYLLENKSATFSDVQDDLAVYVRNILQDELRYEEFDDYGINQEAKDRITARINDIAHYADGIGLVRIAEISCNSDEFDRFRKLTQELWCSEKELDFLRRTNEFQNRLNRVSNDKIIADAQNDSELKASLRNINRDNLLSEDEFEAFASALSIKKFRRSIDAEIEIMAGKTDLEVADITAKTRIALNTIESNESIYSRSIELEKSKLRDQRELNQGRLDIMHDNDAYADERRKANLDFDKSRIDLALSIDDRMNEQEQANLDREEARKRAATEQQRSIIQDQLLHEEKMANIHKDYTAEQLMASKIENMDADAQVAFAGSFSSKKEEEIAREKGRIYDEMMAQQAEREKQLFGFVERMADKNVMVASAQMAKADEAKNEYRDDARYQQSRVDHTQDKALEYTTKSGNPQKVVKTISTIECPACGEIIEKTEKFCPECGCKLS